MAAAGKIPLEIKGYTFGHTGGATSATLTLTPPAIAAAKDLLIAVVMSNGNLNWTAPGWTSRGTFSGTGIGVFTLDLSAAPAANYTFTADVSARPLQGYIICVRGGAWGAIGTYGSVSSNVVTAPAITMPARGILVGAYTNNQSARTWTVPTGMAALQADNDANAPSSAIFTESTVAGSTGTRASTTSGSICFGFLLGVVPA